MSTYETKLVNRRLSTSRSRIQNGYWRLITVSMKYGPMDISKGVFDRVIPNALPSISPEVYLPNRVRVISG